MKSKIRVFKTVWKHTNYEFKCGNCEEEIDSSNSYCSFCGTELLKEDWIGMLCCTGLRVEKREVTEDDT